MISAVIITHNAARCLDQCLQSLEGLVDEVVVMDSYSTDDTPQIAAQHGVQWFQQPWAGYGAQKNAAAARARYPWILSIDADEVLSAPLRASLLALRKGELSGVYGCNRLNVFFGLEPRYGLTQPDFVVRLYHRDVVCWTSRAVHETLEGYTTRQVHRLAGNLLHYSKPSVSAYIHTMNTYSELAAGQLYQQGRRVSALRVVLAPLFTFFKGYVLRRGFLDGKAGLVLNAIQSVETMLKYAKLWVLQQQRPK